MTEAQLHAYVDGLLPESERAQVENYLAARPEVAQRLDAYKKQNQSLHTLFDPVLDEPIPERLRVASAKRPPLRHAAMLAWLAIGVVAGWAVSEFTQHQGFSRDRPRAPGGGRTLVYTPEAKRAVEVPAAEEQAMVNWLSKRMGVQIAIPKLNEAGYQLLGGRLLPGGEGAACQIMYQNSEGKRITLYMSKDDVAPAPVRVVQQGAIRVAYWSDAQLGYAVSGDLPESELLKIANDVSRQL
ncbi:MAG: anti-sigma factor family protein [Burkholderiales bacterium]